MSISRYNIEIRGIPVEVVRKDIKNLHVGVYPPEGKVRVAAPLKLKEDAVRIALVSRIGWIKRQQQKFGSQDRQPRREFVGGETHFVEGKRYRLDITSDKTSGILLTANRRIKIPAAHGAGRDERQRTLNSWYRKLLQSRIAELVPKWDRVVGVQVEEVRIKRMKTKWGSCSQAAGRIWINLELAKKPPGCLEYILVHEMVHLLERQHNERFRQHMNRAMPGWRSLRDELNRAPLSHEEWTY